MASWFKKKKSQPATSGDLATWGPSTAAPPADGGSRSAGTERRSPPPPIAADGPEASYPWIAFFFSLSDGVETGRVRLFAESMADEPTRSQQGVSRLGAIDADLVQVRLDAKRLERSGLSLEQVAASWIDRLQREVSPELALWDYLGVTFSQPGVAPRQIIVRHSEMGITRAITEAGPDGTPVLRAMPG